MARRPSAPKTAAEPAEAGRLFAVTRTRGVAWNPDLPLEEQSGWTEHAAHMNGLEADGLVVAGGPLDNTPYVLLAMRAENADVVRASLAADPWEGSRVIETTRIAPWTLSLGRL